MSREERAVMPDTEKQNPSYLVRCGLATAPLGIIAVVVSALAASAAQMSVQTVLPGQLVSIVGQHLQGPDGADAGRLWDVLVDRAGQPRVAVIEYGGFAGMGRRKVAVAWPALHFQPDDRDHPIALLLNKAEMGRIPDFKDASGPIVFSGPGAGGDAGSGH
jgi:hypothetical protein